MSHRRPILVVEDDQALNPLIRKTLHRAGFEADGVTCGAEALERLAGNHDVLLLLDYRLPDMDGSELVERLRAEGRATPFVVITGQGDERVAVRMMKAGARDYLVKETGFLELLPDRLERVLRQLETERKLAEAEHNLRMFQNIVSASADMLAILNQDFIYLATNAAYLEPFGKTREEVVGGTVESVFGQKFFDAVIRPNAERCMSGEKVNYQEWFDFPADGRRFMDICYYPYLGEDQEILGFVVAGRDVTEQRLAEEERRKLEARVRQAERMESLGVLAGGIAHGFNNMLAAITGNCELAQLVAEPDSEVHGHLEQVMVAALRSASMVKQILAFSRQTEQKRTAVDLDAVVNEAVELLRVSLPAGIAVRRETRGSAPVVFADGTEIQQVIMNLCANAHHAMGDNGTLTLSLATRRLTADEVAAYPEARQGKHAHLAVGDTGRGIAPGVLARVFEPFFTTKEVGEGSGMGLAICHGIAAAHGGFIKVASELGVGSVFHLYLPLATEPGEGIESKPASPEAPREVERGGERVLIVDDEAFLLATLSKLLEIEGYRVKALSSSTEALAALRRSPEAWDLLLTDLTMPEVSGIELLRVARGLRSDLPVVLMTGHDEKLSDYDGGAGANGVLMKPFRAAKLVAEIRRILDD